MTTAISFSELQAAIGGRQPPLVIDVRKRPAFVGSTEMITGALRRDLHELIAERYERTSTLITSNLDFPEWGDAFPNRLLGAATLDRLRHGAYRVILDGESYREPRPLPDTPKSAVAKRGKTDQ